MEFLEAQPGIAAFVDDRIFYMKMHDTETLPAIVVQQTGGRREISHSGSSKLTRARYQISSWAKEAPDAKDVSQQVVKALNGFNGQMGSPGIEVGGTVIELELDDYDANTKHYRTLVDVSFWHRENIT